MHRDKNGLIAKGGGKENRPGDAKVTTHGLPPLDLCPAESLSDGHLAKKPLPSVFTGDFYSGSVVLAVPPPSFLPAHGLITAGGQKGKAVMLGRCWSVGVLSALV